jgi:hypothetical protein
LTGDREDEEEEEDKRISRCVRMGLTLQRKGQTVYLTVF